MCDQVRTQVRDFDSNVNASNTTATSMLYQYQTTYLHACTLYINSKTMYCHACIISKNHVNHFKMLMIHHVVDSTVKLLITRGSRWGRWHIAEQDQERKQRNRITGAHFTDPRCIPVLLSSRTASHRRTEIHKEIPVGWYYLYSPHRYLGLQQEQLN